MTEVHQASVWPGPRWSSTSSDPFLCNTVWYNQVVAWMVHGLVLDKHEIIHSRGSRGVRDGAFGAFRAVSLTADRRVPGAAILQQRRMLPPTSRRRRRARSLRGQSAASEASKGETRGGRRVGVGDSRCGVFHRTTRKGEADLTTKITSPPSRWLSATSENGGAATCSWSSSRPSFHDTS